MRLFSIGCDAEDALVRCSSFGQHVPVELKECERMQGVQVVRINLERSVHRFQRIVVPAGLDGLESVPNPALHIGRLGRSLRESHGYYGGKK